MNVVTVPSFSDFVAETKPTSDSTPIVRIVLSKKAREDKGWPFVEVMLDLQAFNDQGELVWLSRSTTITGFRENDTFEDPRKQAHYEAMCDLKNIVEGMLTSFGFKVRSGRYVLPKDYQPLNGVFDCAEWSRDENDHLQVLVDPDW